MTEIRPLPAEFLAERGYCCGCGCSNCPFVPRHECGTEEVDRDWLEFSREHPGVDYEDYVKSYATTSPSSADLSVLSEDLSSLVEEPFFLSDSEAAL